MSGPVITKEEGSVPFANLKLVQARLVNEQIVAAPATASSEPQSIQTKTETSTAFSVAMNHPTNPEGLQIEIEYKFNVQLVEAKFAVADYSAKHAVEFKVTNWGGFTDWSQVSQTILAPYFSMVYLIAFRRAQGALLDLGLGTLVLPVVTDFGPPNTPAGPHAAAS
jgi:hypothetical protein